MHNCKIYVTFNMYSNQGVGAWPFCQWQCIVSSTANLCGMDSGKQYQQIIDFQFTQTHTTMQTTISQSVRFGKGPILTGLFFLFTIGFSPSCASSAKEGPLLDGQVFTVITIPAGNTADAALEHISFANGRFDNDNCHLWGFGDAPYSAIESGDSIKFKAMTTSEKEGSMTWNGVVINGKLSGTMVWSKQGQSDLAYTFSSESIEMIKLDGRKFDVQFQPGDSTQREVITFENGQFQSPGCYAWGFSPAPYQAYVLNGQPHFQCVYTSKEEGTMLFYGVIDNASISGTQFWTKAGQADMYYTMQGSEVQ